MRLRWRMFLWFFACTLLALAVTAWHANRILRDAYRNDVAADLASRAGLLGRDLLSPIQHQAWDEVDLRCKEFGRLTQTRVTAVLPTGAVIGDSDEDPRTMENHASRSEIAEALKGQIATSIRFSLTTRKMLMYQAVPIEGDGAVLGVVRAALPLSTIEWSARNIARQIAIGILLAALLSALVAWYAARRISRPLDDMRQTAERLAEGDLQARMPMPADKEMSILAGTMNHMAGQLAERMETISRQAEQLRAVLSSMVEGVLAVDIDGRILDINPAAAHLLGIAPDRARGRSVHETLRQVDLQTFIVATLQADTPMESETVLYGAEERDVQLHGTALQDSAGHRLGALIVLNDTSHLKRLERMRQDFVANVSHELKTPITALRGCVETLADPSRCSPEDAEQFMAMIGRQVERMSAIVEDLLSLSRLEHDADHKRIPLAPGAICDVLQRAAQALARAAQEKNIQVTVECPQELIAPINAALLEQAVGNLIDNALKYSGEGTRVSVSGVAQEQAIEIRIADQGPGIERRHLGRIFERFYRVDRARSRALGGTGLGLAIVKHIVLAHDGTVTVDSAPGRGSTFTIRLPPAKG